MTGIHNDGELALKTVKVKCVVKYISIQPFFKVSFIYFERDWKGVRKRGGETLMCKRNMDWLPLACHQLGAWPATQACALAAIFKKSNVI